jgi:uncharacterized protein YggE
VRDDVGLALASLQDVAGESLMKITSLLKTILLFSVMVCAVSAIAQQPQQLALITVTGQAELRVPPDEVVFNLEISKLDKDLVAAQQQTDESVRQILALARRYKVAPQDVQTEYISVGMRYSTDLIDDDEDSSSLSIAARKKVKQEFLGYATSKSVVIRFTDLSNYEQFFADVIKAGVSKVGSVSFGTSQLRKYKDQARTLAIKAAREKAIALTAEIGQSIGKAYSIREEGYSSDSARSNYTGYIATDYNNESNSSFAPGSIPVRAQVTVSFILN